ncbi:hypothetical protein L4D76_27420 [Photobacterium sagamiensis]|uniref:DUF6602 domain-containing protein n=1 Tax=Photobacterium sagamiensis TaxID=2910241 RepID=UPI003D10AF3A
MKRIKTKESGYHGYQEFNFVREKIVSEYEYAKKKYQNRPVKTEHGNVSESLLVNWLKESLPKKYGVTSGYVIPDLYVEKYKVYHFDIIIYDKLESPVLWMEPSDNNTKARAIPAKHIFAIYEVKASLRPKSISDALEKLDSISKYSKLFPDNFHTKAIFMELPKEYINKKGVVLNKFVTDKEMHGYSGSYVFSTNVNKKISATIKTTTNSDNLKYVDLSLDRKSLVKDVEKIDVEIHDVDKFKFYNPEPGYSLDIMSMNGKVAGMVKSYEQQAINNETRVYALWSRNEFAVFFHELLSRLDTGDFNRYQMKFGLSFDEL